MTRNEILQAIIDGKELESIDRAGWEPCTHKEVLFCLADGINTNLFRIKQNTIKVNGWEIIAGITQPLEDGESYFYAEVSASDYFSQSIWSNHTLDKLWLSRGLIHDTKENSIAHTKAMLGIDPNSPNED